MRKSELKVRQITVSDMPGGLVKAIATEDGKEVLAVKFRAQDWRLAGALAQLFGGMASEAITNAHDADIPF